MSCSRSTCCNFPDNHFLRRSRVEPYESIECAARQTSLAFSSLVRLAFVFFAPSQPMNSPLHVAYTLKNQKAFRQLLDRSNPSNSNASGGGSGSGTLGGTSSSGPRSWNNTSILASNTSPPVDVNARDTLGRTVLHRVCSNLEPAGIDYLRMLLNHPSINTNAQDTESRWTPLHRALYAGNLMAAVLLLQRSDVDILLKVSYLLVSYLKVH